MHLFSHLARKSAQKKPPHLHRLGYNVEEKIKRKKYMRSYIWKAVLRESPTAAACFLLNSSISFC